MIFCLYISYKHTYFMSYNGASWIKVNVTVTKNRTKQILLSNLILDGDVLFLNIEKLVPNNSLHFYVGIFIKFCILGAYIQSNWNQENQSLRKKNVFWLITC